MASVEHETCQIAPNRPPPSRARPERAHGSGGERSVASRTIAEEASVFEVLTMPHLGTIARFARSLTRDHSRADDLVQETYLQALRGWHTFQHDADVKRWLYAVCHHTFLRMARREARYVETPDNDPELESLATASAHAAAHRSGIATIAERMDLGQALNRALETLPPHSLGAVVLVDVEGHTYEEAAVILDVPIGTLRSRLFRARRLLQDQLFVYARDAGFDIASPTWLETTDPSPRPATTS